MKVTLIKFFLVKVLIFWLVSVILTDDVTISTNLGDLTGSKMQSRSGRDYVAFTKIPYAEPPVGPLRFQSPKTITKWNGVLDATEEVPICTQIPIFMTAFRNYTFGDEDCLYLNVFSNNLNGAEKFSVMIHIHGGAWRMGSASGALRAANFMDEDIVLVTLNYRLGALGFLSTVDNVIPGNFGMKDQALAIKWVYDNIDKFGGDQNSITLFGESAGGASVQYHAMSPMSKDYIKGIICQSGVATALWSYGIPDIHKERAYKIAQSLNCPTNPHDAMLECLRTKTNMEITDAERQFTVWDFDPTCTLQPVIEVGTPDPFLTGYNFELTIPIISGIVSSEGVLKTQSILSTGDYAVEHFKNNMDTILPVSAMYEYTSNSAPEITEKVKDFYFKGKDALQAFRDVFGDIFFLWPQEEMAKFHKGPLYIYFFDYRGSLSWIDLTAPNLNEGVSHTDELISLFAIKEFLGVELDVVPTPKDDEVSKTMVKLWTNFAKYGNPTPPDSGLTEWRPRQKSNKEYYRIDGNGVSMQDNLWPDRVEFWQSVPLLSKISKK